MTISMRGYDSMLATPPADTDNEYAEEDVQEREHEEQMAIVQDWFRNASGRQVKLAIKMGEAEIQRRILEAANELRELQGSGKSLPRAPRSDKGKPRLPKVVPANETTTHDDDPFTRTAEVSR